MESVTVPRALDGSRGKRKQTRVRIVFTVNAPKCIWGLRMELRGMGGLNPFNVVVSPLKTAALPRSLLPPPPAQESAFWLGREGPHPPGTGCAKSIAFGVQEQTQ